MLVCWLFSDCCLSRLNRNRHASCLCWALFLHSNHLSEAFVKNDRLLLVGNRRRRRQTTRGPPPITRAHRRSSIQQQPHNSHHPQPQQQKVRSTSEHVLLLFFSLSRTHQGSPLIPLHSHASSELHCTSTHQIRPCLERRRNTPWPTPTRALPSAHSGVGSTASPSLLVRHSSVPTLG